MFIPTSENLSGKKRWIGYATNVLGKIIVNEGAKKAILDKCTSLLPIGILEIINDFKQGEVVSILAYGAIVKLGLVSGLLHASEIDHFPVRDVKKVLSVGKKVTVKGFDALTNKEVTIKEVLDDVFARIDNVESKVEAYVEGLPIPNSSIVLIIVASVK